jgi:hypothetical protein
MPVRARFDERDSDKTIATAAAGGEAIPTPRDRPLREPRAPVSRERAPFLSAAVT